MIFLRILENWRWVQANRGNHELASEVANMKTSGANRKVMFAACCVKVLSECIFEYALMWVVPREIDTYSSRPVWDGRFFIFAQLGWRI